jgi:ATP phosphoribosyltransferase
LNNAQVKNPFINSSKMFDKKLIIGMPAGSLANPGRGGNLIQLLEKAGFKTHGYESGGPSTFSTLNYLFGWDGRPQEFGSQLGIGELDVAIAGEDWIQERILELSLEYKTSLQLEKVLSLNRGSVKLVGITNDPTKASTAEFLAQLCASKELITVVTEMPYLALNWIRETLKKINRFEDYADFSVQKYKTPSRIKKGILIYETWGKTESKIKHGGADIGLEITQSGSSIRNYGLTITETVIESETGIYINPDLKHDSSKLELLKMFLLNLYGVVNAENKVMILFNVKNEKVTELESYMAANTLFADEPTKNAGKLFTEFSIQVEIGNKKQPLAVIRYELAKLGAVNIDTIPIDSSIKSMDVLNL